MSPQAPGLWFSGRLAAWIEGKVFRHLPIKPAALLIVGRWCNDTQPDELLAKRMIRHTPGLGLESQFLA